ncbi:MAG: hypothetical protein QW620_04410 [Thermoplasmata archaeon]
MSEEIEKIREYQKVIREILSAFESVSFPVIVESSTGFKVLSIDKDRDNDLIEDISSVARSIVLRYHNQPINRDTYRKVIKRKANAFRPNEVGRILEYEICNTPKDFKTIKEIVSLKQVGYPDIKIIDKTNKVIFVDIKATTRPDVGSPRDFYYSTKEKTIEKIKSDGFHLLLGFIIRETEPEQFTTVGWKLVDLSKIKVSIKAEFNADNLEIYKQEAILKEEWVEKIETL